MRRSVCVAAALLLAACGGGGGTETTTTVPPPVVTPPANPQTNVNISSPTLIRADNNPIGANGMTLVWSDEFDDAQLGARALENRRQRISKKGVAHGQAFTLERVSVDAG